MGPRQRPPTITNRIDAWQHPFGALYDKAGGSYQLAQSLFAQADGGLFGLGFGQSLLTIGTGDDKIVLLPAAQTDLIYSVITNELGLLGAAALLRLPARRRARFKIAMLARDSFSKLLATGLTAVFALQVFVIVGGVTQVIPLTGVTLPFISYGGSSILANFVLLALLLLVSDRRAAEPRRRHEPPITRLYIVVPAAVRACSSSARRGARCSRRRAARQAAEPAAAARAAAHPRAATSGPRTARVLARMRARRRRHVHAACTRRTGCSPTRSATRSRASAAPGLERSRNDELSGTRNELGTIFDRLQRQAARGRRRPHDARPAAQRGRASQGLAGRKGAVVALDPQTGAVKVMASVPGYDPNAIGSPGASRRLNRDPDAPLLNRGTQAGYPPGSTFKVVTAIAAMDSGEFTPRLARQRQEPQADLGRAAAATSAARTSATSR